MKHQSIISEHLGENTDIRASHRTGWLNLYACYKRRGLYLLISDTVSIVLSWHVAKFLNQFYSPLPTPLIWWSWFGYPSVFWIFGFSTVALFSYYQLYSRVDTAKNYARAAQLISYVYIAFLVISYLCDPHLDLPRSLFMSAWISTIFIVIFNRWLTNIAISKILSQYGKPVGVFLIASAERLHYLSTVMHSQPHYRIVGGAIASTAHSPIIIQAIARSMPQEVVAEDIPDAGLASQLFWRLRSMGIILRLLPSSREMMYRRGSPEVFASLPTIRIEVSPFRGFDYFFKRWFDFLFSITAIFILSPLLLIVASAIKISSPGPALFRQERMGLHGKVFHVWKFRTMIYNAEKLQSSLESDNESSDGVMFKIKKDPRVTSLGKILRRTSVDELPQLFNVLLGQMSLVGPRPLPLRDTTFFEPWHHVRHQVLPGITGLWQISGRSNIKSFDDAVRLDLHYIDNWSLNLDLEILLETIKIVCCGKGAH